MEFIEKVESFLNLNLENNLNLIQTNNEMFKNDYFLAEEKGNVDFLVSMMPLIRWLLGAEVLFFAFLYIGGNTYGDNIHIFLETSKISLVILVLGLLINIFLYNITIKTTYIFTNRRLIILRNNEINSLSWEDMNANTLVKKGSLHLVTNSRILNSYGDNLNNSGHSGCFMHDILIETRSAEKLGKLCEKLIGASYIQNDIKSNELGIFKISSISTKYYLFTHVQRNYTLLKILLIISAVYIVSLILKTPDFYANNYNIDELINGYINFVIDFKIISIIIILFFILRKPTFVIKGTKEGIEISYNTNKAMIEWKDIYHVEPKRGLFNNNCLKLVFSLSAKELIYDILETDYKKWTSKLRRLHKKSDGKKDFCYMYFRNYEELNNVLMIFSNISKS
ncbi:MAG TPA: hypothetical protein DCP90_04135 [Clostridiales bacterium]|nr:MAG: hypothetical protein A2Y22_07370 [Clostridiales bacterium GWD2_32_59]HAN09784.1 hypothetical protein [Clostridiales bacterium]